ncbi:unnamed protein product [Durusdinium trenchii]|uniref:Uncharacterized protein n=1 Tax=Durusdinium trenchii TaxID=1381693 RepID=A0ABP0S4U6_9DINO
MTKYNLTVLLFRSTTKDGVNKLRDCLEHSILQERSGVQQPKLKSAKAAIQRGAGDAKAALERQLDEINRKYQVEEKGLQQKIENVEENVKKWMQVFERKAGVTIPHMLPGLAIGASMGPLGLLLGGLLGGLLAGLGQLLSQGDRDELQRELRKELERAHQMRHAQEQAKQHHEDKITGLKKDMRRLEDILRTVV